MTFIISFSSLSFRANHAAHSLVTIPIFVIAASQQPQGGVVPTKHERCDPTNRHGVVTGLVLEPPPPCPYALYPQHIKIKSSISAQV